MKISFNPLYYIKPDKGRAIIMAAQLGRNTELHINETFETIIHPLHAMILSFFDGRELEDVIHDIQINIRIEEGLLKHFVRDLLNCKTYLRVKCNGGFSVFPPNTLITGTYNREKRLSWRNYIYETVNLGMRRHYTPSSITLMVNNICYTQCHYCYADKRQKVSCTIPFERIKEIIQEASSLHVRTFDVIGGEFFLFDNWYELLKVLHANNFHPYLSTKLPLHETTVTKLKDSGIQDIQVSLDSLIGGHLATSLFVDESYAYKIQKTIFLLDKYKIPIYIHTVLSQRTGSIEDIKSIYNFIKDIPSIKEWKIDKAGKSMYANTPYEDIEIPEKGVETIAMFIDSIKDDVAFPIRAPRPKVANQLVENMKEEDFFTRGLCSGNYSSMFILPDGKVTMCEELYWIPKFIIGNIKEQSLTEIWNSQKALNLFNTTQEDIPASSLCHSCSDFLKCRSIKQVCYKEIVKQYGQEKWYLPDVNCPYTNMKSK
jgi:radical SAM domain protein